MSLELRAGASPLEVAQWAGHSPAAMFKHYANVIEELVGEPRLAADEQIIRARDAVIQRPKRELDKLVANLLQRQTVAGEGEGRAATIFFQPN